MANTIFSTALIVLLLANHSAFALPGRAWDTATGAALATHTVTLAGITMEIELPFEAPEFIVPAADDALQAASAARWDPFFEVSLEAIPNTADPSLMVGGVEQTLEAVRAQQAPVALRAHRIEFLGQEIESASNRVAIYLNPVEKEPVIIHEWVTRADGIDWILRVSFTPGQGFNEALLNGIVVRKAEAGAQGPLADLRSQAADTAIAPAATLPAPGDLPQPAWWNGDCDTNYYASKSGGRAAYPLEGIYRGVKACGPRPYYDYAPSIGVKFFPGDIGAQEWQCVELSLRYLYLAYGIPPYWGNGKDIVSNYRGDRLIKIANGQKGKTPQPGDVLSYGPTTTYGHTSVVSASNVDAYGNGTVTVIEQNSSAAGKRDLIVKNWVVQASLAVSGWLHEAKPNPPSGLSTLIEGKTVKLSWTAPTNATIDGYRIYRNGAPVGLAAPAAVSYIDTVPLCTTNYYSVTAYNGSVQSDPTATAAVDIDVLCKVYLPKILFGR